MQIQKIDVGENTGVRLGLNHSPSFGYNPEVNATLIHHLEKQKRNKAFYQYLKSLVNATNEAEQNLRAAEKKKKITLLTLLTATFIPLKVQLSDLINSFFPNLDYRRKELETYQEEVNARNLEEEQPAHWLNALTEILHEQEVQKQAEVATYVLENVMNEQFPNLKFDFSGLTEAYKQKYREKDEDTEEIADTKFDDDIKDMKDLQARIELGKSKVFTFEPSTKEELKGFASLGGMQELKNILNKEIITPLKDTKQAKYNEEHYGIKMPNGILFYGPPGTGKTTIVERLAVEADLPLLELTPDSYGSEYVSGNDINIGAIFDYAASIATEEKPVILLIDDIEGIVGSRTSGNMQGHENSKLIVLLRRIQDAQKNHIIVMATANHYDTVDKAIMRRLRQQYYVGLPDIENRKSILKLLLEATDNGQKIANDSEAVEKIAKLTEGFPISTLEDIVNDARKVANTDFYHTREIVLEDLETAFQKPETQNKKINEDLYKTKATRKSIGF